MLRHCYTPHSAAAAAVLSTTAQLVVSLPSHAPFTCSSSSSLIGLSASGGTHCNAHPRSCYNFTVFILASQAAVSVVDSVPRMSPTLRHSRSCSSPKRHCRQPLPASDILSLTCSLSPRFSVLLFRCFEPLQPADSRARLFRACCHRAQPGFTLASPSPKREHLPWKM